MTESLVVVLGLGLLLGIGWVLVQREQARLRKALASLAPSRLGDKYTFTFEVAGQRGQAKLTKPGEVHLSVSTSPLPTVRLHPASFLDRLGRRIGLDRKFHTGDRSFDARVCVNSDETDDTLRRLLERESVRRACLALVSRGLTVSCKGRKLEVRTRTREHFRRSAEIARLLAELAGELPPTIGEPVRRFWGIALLVTWPLCCYGLSVLSALAMAPPGPWPLDRASFVSVLCLGLGAAVLMVAVLALLVRGRSMAMRTVTFLGLFTLLAVPVSVSVGLLTANRRFDSGPTRTHEVTVVSKAEKGMLTVTSWMPGRRQDAVPCACDFSPGDQVTVREHGGALGWPWAEVMDERR